MKYEIKDYHGNTIGYITIDTSTLPSNSYLHTFLEGFGIADEDIDEDGNPYIRLQQEDL